MLFQELYDKTRQPFKESKTVIDINHVIGSDLEIVLNSENKERLLHYSENQLTKSFQRLYLFTEFKIPKNSDIIYVPHSSTETAQVLSDGTSTPDN